MGEKMTTALASTCASATIGTVKTVNYIRTKKALRMAFSAIVAMVTVCLFAVVTYAVTGTGGSGGSANADGKAVADEMIATIKDWVGIIAGVVIVFGAVNAGLGVANQDEAGRNRGFMTMAGGAIMEGVVQALK